VPSTIRPQQIPYHGNIPLSPDSGSRVSYHAVAFRSLRIREGTTCRLHTPAQKVPYRRSALLHPFFVLALLT
jgi:hypothetical protein